MAELKKCRACGVDVPSNAPFGHCPQCLLELGLGAGPEDAPEPGADSALRTPSSALTEAPGDYIDRYKLLQRIGEGGCGVVYMAEQEEPIRRRVALKVIKPGMDTRAVIARFEAERQALAMMDHPNIAKVLDVGQTATGRPFFVMELVKGVRITEYCDQNNLPTRERLALFTQVCQAIQHAHQKGIIHRDIKPSNILVTLHDGVPVPKVIDFGIAKALHQQRLTDLTLFTAFGQFLGTPAYMSPEQAELSGLDIDTRCDIYALGVLLYELLVGRVPFDGQQLLQAGLDEMRRIIREQEPAKPSTRLITMAFDDLAAVAKQRQAEPPKLINLVRGDLDWIVMKCLEKDRIRRYETSSGLAADIQRHLCDEPVLASPPGHLYRIRKMMRRNKLAFTAVGGVATAVVLGLATSTYLYFQQREARRHAEAEAQKSHQIATFLGDMLQGASPSVALGRDTTMLREIVDKAATRVGLELKGQPEVEANLRALLANVYFELGEFGKAEAMAREVLAMRRKLFGNEHPDVAASLHNLTEVLLAQGKLAEAETMIREALTMEKKLLGNEHLDVARSLHSLGTVLQQKDKLTEAELMHREALTMRKKLLGNEHRDVALSLGYLGTVLRQKDKLTEAELMHREALTMLKKLLGNEHPDVAVPLNNLAGVLNSQGKLAEAETMIREALTMEKKLLGNEHPDVATSLHNLGTVLQRQGKLAEAEIRHHEALTMRKKLLGNEHPDVIDSLIKLALVFAAQDKWAEAESLLLEANELVQQNKQLPAKQERHVIESLVYLYSTWAATASGGGRTQKALEWKEKLIEFDKAVQAQKPGAITNNVPKNAAPQGEISPSAFFAFIDRFLAGTNDAEVARESVEIVGSLPQSVTPTCLLIGIITHQRIGDVATAHKLVQVLNRFASGWDLPGIPTKGVVRLQELAKLRGQLDDRRLDWMLFEETNLNPILDILHALQVNATKTEADALLSLIRQYEARQEQLRKQPNK